MNANQVFLHISALTDTVGMLLLVMLKLSPTMMRFNESDKFTMLVEGMVNLSKIKHYETESEYLQDSNPFGHILRTIKFYIKSVKSVH
jgi:hypothetical protein